MLSFDYHVLGTDKVGGDVLYQSLKSIRTGVLIGTIDHFDHVACSHTFRSECRFVWRLGG